LLIDNDAQTASATAGAILHNGKEEEKMQEENYAIKRDNKPFGNVSTLKY
jgi:hypothetical protein